ncbi:MAG: hypothetical protein K8R21_03995, partial [Leptospira sp.]|nr:hypothetical protein [Leptospira sp.]
FDPVITMKENFFRFVEAIEYTLLNQIKFIEEIDRLFLKPATAGSIVRLIASFSLAVGSTMLHPPYTKGFIATIFLSQLANFALLSVVPYIIGSLIDYFAQNKDRPGKVRLMVLLTDYSSVIYFLFLPLSVVFLQAAIHGIVAYILIFFLLTVLYILNISRGAKYLYDLKDKDSIKFAFFSFFITISLPIVTTIFFSSAILSLLG